MKKGNGLRRSVGATDSVKLGKVTEMVDDSRNKSGLRASMKLNFRSESTLFSASSPLIDAKQARLRRYTFLADNKTEIKEVSKSQQLQIQYQTFDKNGKSPLRASLVRWKKANAELVLGEGCLFFKLAGGDIWKYEIANFEDIAYKKRGSKEFTVQFFDDDKVINVKTDQAEDWIRSIFIEARAQSSVYEECLNGLLPDIWKKALQTESHEESTRLTADLQSQTVQVTRFEKLDMQRAEICLRERVDLIQLSRGGNSMELFEAQQRLSKWLEYNGHSEEASNWHELAEQGYASYALKRKNELIGNKTLKLKSALDMIRSPEELEDMVTLRTLSALSAEKMKTRIEEVAKGLDSVVNSTEKGKDQYEDLI